MSSVDPSTEASGTSNVVDGTNDDIYPAALTRLRRFMLIAGLSLMVAATIAFGLATAVGFLLGCSIAFLNVLWTERAVSALGNSHKRRVSQTGTIIRFLARYVLMALVGYALLSSYPASFRGLLAGLFLPVVAIACEAGHSVLAPFLSGATTKTKA